MGIALKDLIIGKEMEVKDLANRVICIDAPMLLYQFLTTIRQSDGGYFTDRDGNITSHLIGINSRITKLIQYGLKLVIVFDGKAPELKKLEQARRSEIKKDAEEKYKIAMEKKDFGMIEKQVKSGAPKKMEWFCGFILMVTLVWIYLEAVKLCFRLAIALCQQ